MSSYCYGNIYHMFILMFRIAAVCDFLFYCRYVTQGLVKSRCNDVYWEIMERRRGMALARMGFTA
jgi:hypothetical protein